MILDESVSNLKIDLSLIDSMYYPTASVPMFDKFIYSYPTLSNQTVDWQPFEQTIGCITPTVLHEADECLFENFENSCAIQAKVEEQKVEETKIKKNVKIIKFEKYKVNKSLNTAGGNLNNLKGLFFNFEVMGYRIRYLIDQKGEPLLSSVDVFSPIIKHKSNTAREMYRIPGIDKSNLNNYKIHDTYFITLQMLRLWVVNKRQYYKNFKSFILGIFAYFERENEFYLS